MIDLSNKPLTSAHYMGLNQKKYKTEPILILPVNSGHDSDYLLFATLCNDKLMESDLELSSILLTYTLQKNPYTP